MEPAHKGNMSLVEKFYIPCNPCFKYLKYSKWNLPVKGGRGGEIGPLGFRYMQVLLLYEETRKADGWADVASKRFITVLKNTTRLR